MRAVWSLTFCRIHARSGNLKSVVSLARRNGIDVLLNSESKRETPSFVNFGAKQARCGPLLLLNV